MNLHLSVAEILWDMEKFYDLLEPAVMARLALRLEYPVVPLYMGLLIHRAARVIRLSGSYSEFVMPARSILAGCTQSVAWTRCFLYDTLEELHRSFKPCSVSSWVDDLSQRQSGLREAVSTNIVNAATFLARSIQTKGSRVSPKSTILASDPTLAREIQLELSNRGVQLKVSSEARDLGIDATCAKKRRLQTQKGRFAKSIARAKVIKGLVKKKAQAKSLVNTGAKPQLTWGHQSKGMAPSTISELKATLGVCSGYRKSGGCTTTALQMFAGVQGDPEYFIRKELFDTWIQVWEEFPNIHLAINQVWENLKPRLGSQYRWNRATGFISAVICTLRDIGWEPVSPNAWRDGKGFLWEVSSSNPLARLEFGLHLEDRIQAKIWAKASAHYLGEGLQGGVDWTVPRKLSRAYRAHNRLDRAGCLSTILQGAFWTADRKAQSGYDQVGVCPRCQQAQDTPLHQFWLCSHNHHIGEGVVESEHLMQEAVQGVESHACFWLRGLVPKGWTFREVPKISDFRTWGILNTRMCNLQEGLIAGTDGSGGEYSSDVRLRRVGWGLVLHSTANTHLQGLAYGTVAGAQTVPRAELYAIAYLAAYTQGDIEALVDSSYVVKGFNRGPGYPQSRNKDLWGFLWSSMGARRGKLLVTKVRAHATESTLIHSQPPPLHFIVNSCADMAAARGADLARLSREQVKSVHDMDTKALLVHNRLVSVTMHILESQQRIKVERAPKPPKRKAELAATLSQMLLDRQHDIRQSSSSIRCVQCLKTSPKGFAHLWVGGPCNRASPSGVHPSHEIHMKIFRGIRFCGKCGGIAVVRTRSLKLPCPAKPSVAGGKVLKRILKGQLPFGMKSWPDQG